jgi:hypothetical protein
MFLFFIESSYTRAAFAKIENNWSYAEPQLKKMGIHNTNVQVPFENRAPHWQPRLVRLIFRDCFPYFDFSMLHITVKKL